MKSAIARFCIWTGGALVAGAVIAGLMVGEVLLLDFLNRLYGVHGAITIAIILAAFVIGLCAAIFGGKVEP